MIRTTTKIPYLVKIYMGYFGYVGMATVWDTIYFSTIEAMNNTVLMQHELVHIEQMKREGKLWYLLKYHYYWLKYGYQNNPYEIEARKESIRRQLDGIRQ